MEQQDLFLGTHKNPSKQGRTRDLEGSGEKAGTWWMAGNQACSRELEASGASVLHEVL